MIRRRAGAHRWASRHRAPHRPHRAPTRQAVHAAAFAFTVSMVLTLFTGAFLPMLWGWKPVVVTSGSMSPLITRGDVVVVDPAATGKAGDVVMYDRPGTGAVTHRIVGYTPDGRYLTKGDANPQRDPQPVTAQAVEGRVRLLVPYLGLPGLRLRTVPAGVVLALGVAALALLALRRRPRLVATAATALVVAVPAGQQAQAAFLGSTGSDVSLATNSQFYRDAVLAADPVSYWRLGETGGTRADQRGLSPLTCSGVTGGTTGALPKDPNTAMTLPAKTAYCRATSAAAHNLTGPFTVVAWERATSWPQTANGRIVAKYGGGTGTLNYMLAWDTAGTAMRAIVDTSTGRYQTVKAMTADSDWHQVAMTWDGTNLRLFVDGTPADGKAAPGTPVTTSTVLTVGYTASDSAVGDVDEVAIFARAFSTAEIAALYAQA
ncbi:signal peptidase I [Actinoplanes sp. NBRC 101535]|uniref:signal peptidase I n=1 Tax=Actinoplanes sp. NBRC 101535 TaxID=3032196 RepID=UPI0024A3A36D|nr:signal peptidase I [Actinoplanes sp. NBRC 101535]GLY00506.1 hypothetical protein Acsp01_08850 [Actinoplanes sp. NBRC 101535]